jgi:hypothetical protein
MIPAEECPARRSSRLDRVLRALWIESLMYGSGGLPSGEDANSERMPSAPNSVPADILTPSFHTAEETHVQT